MVASGPPTRWASQAGIFTRAMSSSIGWCEQASTMSTRSPGRRRSIAAAPRTISARSPFARASRIEKEVSGTSGGVWSATRRNACESVTTSAGGSRSAASAAPSASSLTTRHQAS